MPPPSFSAGAAPQVDMLVGDIYGERDYTSIGLSASTIASSFGKAWSRPAKACLSAVKEPRRASPNTTACQGRAPAQC